MTVRLEIKNSIILTILHQLESFLDNTYCNLVKITDILISHFAVYLRHHAIKLGTLAMSAIEVRINASKMICNILCPNMFINSAATVLDLASEFLDLCENIKAPLLSLHSQIYHSRYSHLLF